MKKIISTIIILHCYLCNAQIVFQKTVGGMNDDFAYIIQKTKEGGYIIVGRTNSFGEGSDDVYLILMDDNWDTIWTKTYGGINADVGRSVKQIENGGFVILGYTRSFGVGFTELYLIKTDIIGDTIWTKTYGGNSWEYGYSIIQTANNGYVISGTIQSFGAGLSDVCLIRTDTMGDTLWTRTYGGTGGDGCMSVQQTADGGYIVLGTTNSFGAGSNDVYLIRTNANGDTLWTRTYGGVNGDEGYSVLQTADSGFAILAGTASFTIGSVYLIRTDANGDTLWTRTYGGSCGEIAWAFDQTSDGGYILGGYHCPYNAFTSVGYLLRLGNNGNVLWSKSYHFGSNMVNIFYDVKQTSDGGFIAVGETGDFFTRDVYVVKTDADGNSGCGDSTVNTITGSTNTIVGTPATMVGSGAIVGNTATITGSTATVDSVLCIDTLTGINENFESQNAKLKIYPNPFSSSAIIKFNSIHETLNSKLVIYDLTGRKIKTYLFAKGQNIITVHADEIGTGMFFVQLITKGSPSSMQKIVVY